MADINFEVLSESEEMYLVTIARLIEDGTNSPVPLSTLAREMDILAVSANQMIRKMADEGLVEYLPYKGVELTSMGRASVRRILRHRRLWEIFLVEKLGLAFSEAESLACRMEHITADYISSRLSDYLGNPAFDTFGNPVPTVDDEESSHSWVTLSSIEPGENVSIIQLRTEPPIRSFLASEGVGPGTRLQVIGIGIKNIVIKDVNDHLIKLERSIADSILVQPS
jgi:DtxR family Mn-dependent transcriptional regulator